MGEPRVSVIVVSFRVRDLLRRCLESVRGQVGVDLESWVVDNASDDGSADTVAREFPDVRLIRSDHNLGFAAANNVALARATGDTLLLLNPDTELPPGALAELPRVFARHPDAGCVGFALVNDDGSPQPWCHAFPGVLNQTLEAFGLHRWARPLRIATPSFAPVPKGGEGPVDWVAGACFAISRRAYETVGGLEAGLFLYGEEPDWCWRARRAGFRTIASARVRVLHHGGASSVGAEGPSFVRTVESRVAFMRRHRGAWRAEITREILTVASLLRLILWQIRAWVEGPDRNPVTRAQLDRFRAVLSWRFGSVR